MSPKRTTWHIRQLTVYEQFGCINMRAVTFSFVDRSSSRGLKKFGEKIPTSPISPEVIHGHTLNFKPNFKFSRLKFFGGSPSQLGCALGSLGQSLAHVKISGQTPPSLRAKMQSPEKCALRWVNTHVNNFFVCGLKFKNFS